MNLDCPSMEDEQNCAGSTPSYCRANQFRCGSTCIPEVSTNMRERIWMKSYWFYFANRLGVVIVIEVHWGFYLKDISFWLNSLDCADGSDEPPSCG